MAKKEKKKLTAEEKAANDAKRKEALANWRADVKAGRKEAPKRKSIIERLAIKKNKLDKLLKQVDVLKKEVAVLDTQANKAEKKKFMSLFTVEELESFWAAKSATK